MRWIDIITLRSATANLEALNNEFLLSIIESKQTKSLEESKIYRRHTMETDLSVHLYWDTEVIDKKGNSLVQYLIRFLKQYGLVNHSTWVEQAPSVPVRGSSVQGSKVN